MANFLIWTDFSFISIIIWRVPFIIMSFIFTIIKTNPEMIVSISLFKIIILTGFPFLLGAIFTFVQLFLYILFITIIIIANFILVLLLISSPFPTTTLIKGATVISGAISAKSLINFFFKQVPI